MYSPATPPRPDTELDPDTLAAEITALLAPMPDDLCPLCRDHHTAPQDHEHTVRRFMAENNVPLIQGNGTTYRYRNVPGVPYTELRIAHADGQRKAVIASHPEPGRVMLTVTLTTSWDPDTWPVTAFHATPSARVPAVLASLFSSAPQHQRDRVVGVLLSDVGDPTTQEGTFAQRLFRPAGFGPRALPGSPQRARGVPAAPSMYLRTDGQLCLDGIGGEGHPRQWPVSVVRDVVLAHDLSGLWPYLG